MNNHKYTDFGGEMNKQANVALCISQVIMNKQPRQCINNSRKLRNAIEKVIRKQACMGTMYIDDLVQET